MFSCGALRFFPGERGGFLVAGPLGMDKPRNFDSFDHGRLVPERTHHLQNRNPTFEWPTQTLADVLDLASQIDLSRSFEETYGHHDAGFRSGGPRAP
jgi:hypothetical protein